MVGTFHFRVLQIVVEVPAFFHQSVAQGARPFPARFIGTRIEPDAQWQLVVKRFDQSHDYLIIPPYRWRHYSETREDIRKP